MRSKGPSLTTRVLWSLLSITATVLFFGAGSLIRILGNEEILEDFTQSSWANGPYILAALYVFPLLSYLAFKSLIMSKYQKSDERESSSEIEYPPSDIVAIKSKYARTKVAYYSFILVSGAAIIAGSMTQQDWPLLLAPFFMLTYVLSAIAIGRLASALGRRGQYWGLLAIACPILGAVIGYAVIGRAANQLVNQIRWQVPNT